MNTYPCALAWTHRYVSQMKTKEALSAMLLNTKSSMKMLSMCNSQMSELVNFT